MFSEAALASSDQSKLKTTDSTEQFDIPHKTKRKDTSKTKATSKTRATSEN